MSNNKEALQKMYFGFATDGTKLTFTQVKEALVKSPQDDSSHPVPIDKLKWEQKKLLATEYLFWDDLYIGDDHIAKDDAVDVVKSGNALGEELVKLLMGGYSHIYRNFMQHDERKYSALVAVQNRRLDPLEDIDKAVVKVTVTNNLSVEVEVEIHYIYSTDKKQHLCYIPAGKPEVLEVEYSRVSYNGELWVANDKHSNKVVGAYFAYPGCTTWIIVSFAKDSFFPSQWRQDDKLKVCIKNNLKTYVCIWQVMPNGSLCNVYTMQQNAKIHIVCYIGTSFVATQRTGTVISKFFVNSAACQTWSIDIDTLPGGEEIYITGDNNYIFYQIKTPQDDMKKPASIFYHKQIMIPFGVKFLYASLFDSCNSYFAPPKNVIVTIISQDKLGGATQYTGNTDKESLYIQMTDDGQGLQKLCVKNPVAGTWTITIIAMTNTPVYFQFQTVPTKDAYDTMEATLFPKLGSNWKTAFAGFTNIADTQKSGGAVIPAVVAAVGMALSNSKQHHILLVDANGADKDTEFVYKARKMYLYPGIELGAFRGNNTKLVGENEAVMVKFLEKLADSKFGLVSVAGHGSKDYVSGYTAPGVRPSTPILRTADVTAERANGKIFHLLACDTADSLGPKLVEKNATAYIGYNELFETSTEHQLLFIPDCTIDLDLIEGRTVNEAVENAKLNYGRLMNNEKLMPHESGILGHNSNALTVLGNGNARLV